MTFQIGNNADVILRLMENEEKQVLNC
jgi:hypothetical protein